MAHGPSEFPKALAGVYLDTPRQWTQLAKLLRAAGTFGLDTEFYGLDVRKQSCVGRARVHVWSVAVRTERRSPLGFARARGWVLPAAALEHPALRAVLEDPDVVKAVHNQPVDDHALANHGVRLRGAINTLGFARWVWPDLVTGGGFGLKNIMFVKLRREPVCEFEDVVTDTRTVTLTKSKKKKRTDCSCGVKGCRLRKGHEKFKVEYVEEYTIEKEEEFQYPLEEIVPGHKRWALLEKYAAEDAVAAVEGLELMEEEPDPAPWPYGTGKRPGEHVAPRPEFSQEVENQIVLMERVGFAVDTEYCRLQHDKAEADEAKELKWLRKWYRANAPDVDEDWPDRTDEQVNKLWSSPKQLLELFDAIDLPRSPVWKKGRTKPDKPKLDGTALEWIGKNSGAKQLIKHLIHLKRIRSGKKYLLKLRDCGGWVNVICGPAGDKDDRNGAVTGRLGIKGTLEAQQLPQKEELDLYQIRKAIIA
jgi:hypothetical protein